LGWGYNSAVEQLPRISKALEEKEAGAWKKDKENERREEEERKKRSSSNSSRRILLLNYSQ
jgi:hypothetical protein